MQIVINTPGTFITQKNECFCLKQKEKSFEISPAKVESLVISNQAMITSQVIVMALEHNIDVVFMDSYGDPIGRVWFSKMGSTALIRRRQLEAMDSSLGMRLVTDMIIQKLDNQILFLKKLMHARPGRENIFTTPIERIKKVKTGLATESSKTWNLRATV